MVRKRKAAPASPEDAPAEEPAAEIAEPEAPPLELTIDELAARTKLPSRTIRFYQSKGALGRPKIRGRTAYYGPEHLERLELISELKDRGLTIKAIRDLVQRIDRGELELGEWLGLEERLTHRWSDDAPRILSEDELLEKVGGRRPGFVAELEHHGLVARERDSFLVRSPALLEMTLGLERSGVDLETAVQAGTIMRRHLSKAADELATWFLERAGRGFGESAAPEQIGAALDALRPTGLEAVSLIFGQEIERAIGELVRTGRASKVSTRK